MWSETERLFQRHNFSNPYKIFYLNAPRSVLIERKKNRIDTGKFDLIQRLIKPSFNDGFIEYFKKKEHSGLSIVWINADKDTNNLSKEIETIVRNGRL